MVRNPAATRPLKPRPSQGRHTSPGALEVSRRSATIREAAVRRTDFETPRLSIYTHYAVASTVSRTTTQRSLSEPPPQSFSKPGRFPRTLLHTHQRLVPGSCSPKKRAFPKLPQPASSIESPAVCD